VRRHPFAVGSKPGLLALDDSSKAIVLQLNPAQIEQAKELLKCAGYVVYPERRVLTVEDAHTIAPETLAKTDDVPGMIMVYHLGMAAEIGRRCPSRLVTLSCQPLGSQNLPHGSLLRISAERSGRQRLQEARQPVLG